MIFIQLLKNNMIATQDDSTLFGYLSAPPKISIAENDRVYCGILKMDSSLHGNDVEQGG